MRKTKTDTATFSIITYLPFYYYLSYHSSLFYTYYIPSYNNYF